MQWVSSNKNTKYAENSFHGQVSLKEEPKDAGLAECSHLPRRLEKLLCRASQQLYLKPTSRLDWGLPVTLVSASGPKDGT